MPTTFHNRDWNTYAQHYDALLHLAPYRALIKEVADGVLQFGPSPFLDAGCGTGNLIAHLQKSDYTEGITGIDDSTEMLTRATRKCPHVRFEQADLNARFPFPDQSFNTIACISALYTVHDPAHLLQEFRRLLKPGGFVVIVTPKHGYENGLILKEHCKSKKPDAYWKDLHRSPEREEQLIREAVADKTVVQQLLFVARVNRYIVHERQFHFFAKEELLTTVRDCGLSTITYKTTYAQQSHLLFARKW